MSFVVESVSKLIIRESKLTHKSQRECLTHWVLCPYVYTLLSPQDLKPSNLAVNEDCELKVKEKEKCLISTWRAEQHSLLVPLLYVERMITAACHTDPGFWLGEAHRWWNDRLCCHAVVPSSRDHAELDALQHDRYLCKIAEPKYVCPCGFYIYNCNMFS